MSNAQRDALLHELEEIMFGILPQDADFMKIRLIPRVRELIAELHAIDSAIAKAECDYLRRLVQSKRGPHGERLWRYAEQIEMPLPGEDPVTAQERHPIYAPLEVVLRTPKLRQELLTRDRLHLTGYIRGMGEMDLADREALRDYVDTALVQYGLKVAQLALPFAEVALDDVRKTGLDKVGDEAAMEPRQAAGGDYLK